MVGGFVLGTVISTLQKSYFIVFKKAAVFVIRISKRGLSNSRACSLQHGTSINFSIHQMLLLICWHTAQTSMCYFAGFLIDLCVDTGDVPGNKASLTAPAIRWLILCQAKMSEKKMSTHLQVEPRQVLLALDHKTCVNFFRNCISHSSLCLTG